MEEAIEGTKVSIDTMDTMSCGFALENLEEEVPENPQELWKGKQAWNRGGKTTKQWATALTDAQLLDQL